MLVVILGSGTSTGVPMIGCDCRVCRSPDPRNHRTRASLWIHVLGIHLLVDTSTDLRIQALREGLRRIDAVLYTHAHADHVHGIDELRSYNHLAEGKAIPCYGAPRILDQIRRRFAYIFDGTSTMPVQWRPRLELCPVEGPFRIGPVLVTPIPIFHGPGRMIYGYRIGGLAYLTDCSGIPPESYSLLKDLDVLILDATRYRAHPTHLNLQEALDLAGKLQARQTILTHLSHDYDHAQVETTLPEGVCLAYDGMRWEMPDPVEREE